MRRPVVLQVHVNDVLSLREQKHDDRQIGRGDMLNAIVVGFAASAAIVGQSGVLRRVER